MKKRISLGGLVVAAALSVAPSVYAGGGKSQSRVASPSASPSFVNDIAPVLKSRCSSCHLTGAEFGGLVLTPAGAHKSLVGIPAVEAPKLKRIVPGNPGKSYLMLKLEGKHLDAGGSGARMPIGGGPLSASTLDMFRKWIAAGAPSK